MNKSKKTQANIVNIIAGIIVIGGGIALLFNYINLGLLLAGLGGIIEAIKITVNNGLK